MRVLMLRGPHAGKVLDMSTRQAEYAIAGGLAKSLAAEDSPAVPQADGDPSDAGDIEVASVEPREETAVLDKPRKPRRVGK
jgi:hypothetical protein